MLSGIALAVCVLALAGTGTVLGQLKVVTKDQPACVFAEGERKLAVVFHNAGQDFDTNVSLRLLQISSTTAVPVSVTAWKRLRVLSNQTVMESATVSFPMVRAASRFLIQWLVGTNHVLGTTEVFVFPTNLLAQLKTLAGDGPVGLFDPANELKPLLRGLAIEFADIQEEGTDKYHGKLAIFGPFGSRTQMRASLKEDIRALARRGVAVVWLQPPPEKLTSLKPSFYTVSEGEGTIILAAHELVAGLTERPEAQLNLSRLAEAALHPTALTLPETETSH